MNKTIGLFDVDYIKQVVDSISNTRHKEISRLRVLEGFLPKDQIIKLVSEIKKKDARRNNIVRHYRWLARPKELPAITEGDN